MQPKPYTITDIADNKEIIIWATTALGALGYGTQILQTGFSRLKVKATTPEDHKRIGDAVYYGTQKAKEVR